MKKVILYVVLAFIGLTALTYLTGYNKVLFTKTVVKAQRNAEREVFEQTQSFVEAKKSEALKYYREYLDSESDDKETIKAMVRLSFENFDESKLEDPLRSFIYECKYK